ncbi:post-GPI attachment to proteins factor 6 [Esox lucius]|uniref:EGF-like domain-containing protein n=1 Tax=Esox lucius TaxID=8010 RepID=A0A3P8YMA5_ESOLU|nr:post-GPI attachment to proteins factor 6 [Esox lucius]
MEIHILTILMLFGVMAAAVSDGGEMTLVQELSSNPAQKLSRYGWYGNVRLAMFRIPDNTVTARWLFTVTRGNEFHCGTLNVTMYMRWGAPPVINPVGRVFPNNTMTSPVLTLNLPMTSPQSNTTFNLSNPAPGDWYLAVHLPQDDGRIQHKGFPSCTYSFQPQLSIRRAVDTTILQATPLTQFAAPGRPALLRVFIPEFVSSLSVSVSGCSWGEGLVNGDCLLVLILGSSSLEEGLVTVNCSLTGCSGILLAPPWNTWMRVTVESYHSNRTTNFSISANYTVGWKPQNVGLSSGDNVNSLHGSATSTGNTSVVVNPGLHHVSSGCVWNVPVLRDELDVLSVRFSPANGPNVTVTSTQPTLLTYSLDTHSAGGTLNLQLLLNTANVTMGNSSVSACLSPWAPVLNHTQPCHTALFPGYELTVSADVPRSLIRVPFPQAATWYLVLQLTCYSECGNATIVTVTPELYVSACIEDCGIYGECRLLRSYSFLYAACVCKAGWSGWGCTDDITAQSYSRQLTAVLLLTISNLFFIPPIVIAVRRLYITEASVYLFTMFFSTFYHACDQPGVSAMCIMDYDTLQFCDFLGSVSSIWVTVLCMARITDTLKHMLFMLGSLLIAMSMQLDRRGLWNMLGPILFAVLVMGTTWVYRGVKRRRCYPPSWRRWVLFLLPGLACVLVGVCLYVFAETEDNYLYTHSLWHVLVASSVVFLLPPRGRDNTRLRGWGWLWDRSPQICGYTLCHSTKEELYTVT